MVQPSVLEWADRILDASNESELRSKYHNTFWEGGSKRDLKAIRDKWSAATPPVERQTRQRQTRGSMQEARDQMYIGMTEEENVGLIRIFDRLSRSAIGSKTAQSYATTKTYAYEDYLIRKPGSTLEVSCEHCGRRSVDTIVRYWKTNPEFYVAHLTETCSTIGCTGFQ
jgi:hypothetical protein